MGNRLSKIYTRTGDDGTTGLGDGSRTEKDGLRVEAFGTVDELNSAIGVAVAELERAELLEPVQQLLNEIQHHLFDLGGELRSEEHTSELQSRGHLVCRLLLEKKTTSGCATTAPSARHPAAD